MTTTDLTRVKGIGPETAALLVENGIDGIESLVAASLEQITAIPGFGPARTAAVQQAAASHIEGTSPTPETLEPRLPERQESLTDSGKEAKKPANEAQMTAKAKKKDKPKKNKKIKAKKKDKDKKKDKKKAKAKGNKKKDKPKASKKKSKKKNKKK